jgi:hypothetical protein
MECTYDKRRRNPIVENKSGILGSESCRYNTQAGRIGKRRIAGFLVTSRVVFEKIGRG